MNENFEKIIEEAKKVSLRKEEKTKIREFLLSFIKENPILPKGGVVIKDMGFRLKGQETQSSWSNILVNSFKLVIKPMPLAILLIIAVSGGVSFASGSALPGEPLYPVKINFNEEVRSMLTFSTEAKADFETQRLNKRIEEAEELAIKGKLDSKIRAQIESSFEDHSEQINKEIQKLEAQGNLEASAKINSKFEASLKAHERILEEILEEIDEVRTEIKTNLNPLSLKVKQEAKIASESKVRVGEIISGKVRASEEAKTEAEISAQSRLKAAEKKITESKKFIERAKKLLNQEAVIEAEAKIQAAEDAMLEGKAKIETGDLNGALFSFQEAFSLAQEAKVLAKARTDLRINIRLESRDDRQNNRVEENNQNNREENLDNGRNDTENDQNQNQDNGQNKNQDGSGDSDSSIDIEIDSEIKVNPDGKIKLNL